MLRHSLVVFSAALSFISHSASSAVIYPGSMGNQLRKRISEHFQPRKSCSYRESREEMFGHIDNFHGFVTLLYAGKDFRTTGIPNPNVVNTEHTWPQSRFGRQFREKQKTDLHHLFPSHSVVNASRGNLSFGEIEDGEVRYWWGPVVKSCQRVLHELVCQNSRKPREHLEEFSRSNDDYFEPRDSDKGNIARALAYFYATYYDTGIDRAWFERQLPTLMRWHKMDPADAQEEARNEAIEEFQGNENPFIIDPTLMVRVFASRAH